MAKTEYNIQIKYDWRLISASFYLKNYSLTLLGVYDIFELCAIFLLAS